MLKIAINSLSLALASLALLLPIYGEAAETTRVSVSSAGVQGNARSQVASVSADGRFVAFASAASNLVPADTNGFEDVFVRDRQSGTTTRVSLSSTGEQSNWYSTFPSISADGRFVTFGTYASNLVDGDTNDADDIFVRDLQTGKTGRVSVSSAEEQGNGFSVNSRISANGRFVVFMSDANNLVPNDTAWADAFVRDRQKGTTERVSVNAAGLQANGNSNSGTPPAISADGRFVVFASYASDLVAGDTSGTLDIFVRDRQKNKTERVNVASSGVPANNHMAPLLSISADGRFVAFTSDATNLVTGDTNNAADVFIRDRLKGTTERVSVDSAELQANSWNYAPSISADGRYVTFSSFASNLVAGDVNGEFDVFIRDRISGTTKLVSANSSGKQGDFESAYSAISADGRFVAFESFATNLVAKDSNGYKDVFIRDLLLTTANKADLRVSVTGKPSTSVQQGTNAVYSFTILNNGPDDAGNVTLTDIVSNGRVSKLVPSQGRCSNASVSLCRLGSLKAGKSATLTATITALASPLTQQVSVNASPLDGAPLNNRVKISTAVLP